MAKREFLQKCHKQVTKNGINKYDVRGWFASEKKDGVRCYYDGGISRGLDKLQVPYANNKSKDERFVTAPICTGLWSSLGNIIHAPDWFLDQLPNICLDGELWSGRKQFQKTTSIVSKIVPNDSEWKDISFNVFDSPDYAQVFANGEINNSVHFIKTIDLDECLEFVRHRISYSPRFWNFERTQKYLESILEVDRSDEGINFNKVVQLIPQIRMTDMGVIDDFLTVVLQKGGEGVVFRNPVSFWEPKRSHCCVKLKPYHDDEGIVKNFTWGRETDKGSKLLGLMGAMVLDYKGKTLELSGFTDDERRMTFMPFPDDRTERQKLEAAFDGERYPGEKISRDWFNEKYPIGSVITFRYRELSDDGLPKEASFDRLRFGHA